MDAVRVYLPDTAEPKKSNCRFRRVRINYETMNPSDIFKKNLEPLTS
jgi:hypothetical protein